jgi:predicted DNA-binding transcriptional regulator YafY
MSKPSGLTQMEDSFRIFLTRSRLTYAVFELNIIINKELISLFLRFGKDFFVLETGALKEIIGSELKSAANNY